MKIGVFAGHVAGGPMDRIVEAAAQAKADGVAAFWLPQIFGFDALTALAVVGREVPDIELGTGVVPTYPRHPVMLAQQALTVQGASGGRLTLGIGLSHQVVIEGMFGLSFDQPVRHMREYLEILVPLLHDGRADLDGEVFRTHAGINLKGTTACPVLVAALGPRMLELAGTHADGTLTWMTGPETLRSLTIPTITAAAARAERPAPRIGVGLPVCVTDDVTAARERAASVFEMYGTLPSYRAMLDREGAAGPADVALVGDEDHVTALVDELQALGATDLVANSFGSDEERERTRALLRRLARR
jgi:5,10-methylenetetrahydromethanopterin reductase